MASHIVGGEFELLHIAGTTYRLNLILYFDLNNGNPGAKDQFADASIYSKNDNKFIATQRLPLTNETVVSYTQPLCSKGEIKTSKLIYTSQINLDPATYNDPGGYYISWQRCCRNYSITNIYSQDPSSGGLSAGQTFYLEFPAVQKDGQPFFDSTPKLFPPLNDYACKGRPYYVDFSGTDDDGDSLIYSMVTPLNTKSSTALPAPSPRPYPEVLWRTDLGFSLANITKGKPDLRISKEGLLTGTPGTAGLFVFAVKVEEFRNKLKIGESRRDFQMLVLDCPTAVAPKILGKKLSDTNFTYAKNMNVNFSNTLPNEQRCIQVRVSDDDSKNASDGFQENITLRVIGLNFKSKDLNSVLPSITTTTLKNGSTKEFSICFPQCPFINGPYQLGIIVSDDACSLPLMDTLKVTVDTQPPFNTPPYFKTPTATINKVLNEGDQASWPFEIIDDQQDEIITSLLTNGFLLKNAGMKFSITEQMKGSVKGTFSWDAYCDIYDFTKRTDFQVTIQADDNDICNADIPIKRIFNLGVLLPPIDLPTIFTDLRTTKSRTINLERRINEPLNFNIFASELTDKSTIDLKLVDNSTFSAYGVIFKDLSGKKDISSRFQWDLTCAKVDPSKRSSFGFRFIASDNNNKCHFNRADTVDVLVKVLPPLNNPPVLSVASLNDLKLSGGRIDAIRGQPIELSIVGNDVDSKPEKDLLKLNLLSAVGNVEPKGFEFSDGSTGRGSLVQKFSWNPDCTIFKDGVYTNNYTFKFKLSDDHCYTAKTDSTTIKINIKDIQRTNKEFLPPNVITPNGDGCNDYFAMEGFENELCNGIAFDGQAADARVSLPLDNCTGQFQTINIYNRWGNEVFKSTDRKFRWYALNESAGVYYFTLKYSDKEYKGTISVRN